MDLILCKLWAELKVESRQLCVYALIDAFYVLMLDEEMINYIIYIDGILMLYFHHQ